MSRKQSPFYLRHVAEASVVEARSRAESSFDGNPLGQPDRVLSRHTSEHCKSTNVAFRFFLSMAWRTHVQPFSI